MSTDTMAWFDRPASLAAESLRDQLAAEPAVAALIPRFGPRWIPQAWACESNDSIVGPGGLALRLDDRIASAYHLLRFSTFVSAGDDHALVRRAFHAIARALGSGRAVITHELAATTGAGGLDGVIDALTRSAGPAATTYAELAGAESWGPRSWIIDTFDDLG